MKIQIDTVSKVITVACEEDPQDNSPFVQLAIDNITKIIPLWPHNFSLFFFPEDQFKPGGKNIVFKEKDTDIWHSNVDVTGYTSPEGIYFGLLRPLKRGIFNIEI